MDKKMITYLEKKAAVDYSCPVTYTMSVLGGKWKPIILFCVANGIYRFGEMI